MNRVFLRLILDSSNSSLVLVPKGGLEPPRVSPPPPQDGVSASSTTSALGKRVSENRKARKVESPLQVASEEASYRRDKTRNTKLEIRKMCQIEYSKRASLHAMNFRDLEIRILN